MNSASPVKLEAAQFCGDLRVGEVQPEKIITPTKSVTLGKSSFADIRLTPTREGLDGVHCEIIPIDNGERFTVKDGCIPRVNLTGRPGGQAAREYSTRGTYVPSPDGNYVRLDRSKQTEAVVNRGAIISLGGSINVQLGESD